MDIKPSDLPLLLSLNALLEENNVTRAAEKLNLSQPALSAQLARLRDLFDDPLLVPSETGRGMIPTSRAVALKAPLMQALQQLIQALDESEVFDPSVTQRCFNIAANDNAIAMFGLELIRNNEQAGFNGIKIAFRSPEPEIVVSQMERGDIDCLLATERIIPSALKTKPLSRERYCMAQCKGHSRGMLLPSIDDYCAAKHILVSSTGGFRSFIDEQLEVSGRRRNVAIAVPHYNLVPSIVAMTDYVCTLPSRFLRQFEDRLDIFPLPFPLPEFTLSLAWHPRNDLDSGHRWLREQFSRLAMGDISTTRR